MFFSGAAKVVWVRNEATNGIVYSTHVNGVEYIVKADILNQVVSVFRDGVRLSHDFHDVKGAIESVDCNWSILNVAV